MDEKNPAEVIHTLPPGELPKLFEKPRNKTYTNHFLDHAKARLPRAKNSDYALAKALKVSPQAISKMRAGGAMSNTTALRLAEILGYAQWHEIIELCEIERAAEPELRKLWERIRDAAVIATMAIGAASFGVAPQPVHARSAFDIGIFSASSPAGGGASHARGEYTLRSIRRRSIGDALLRFLAWLTAAVAL